MKKGRKTSAVLAAMLAASTLLAGCGDSGNGAQGADGTFFQNMLAGNDLPDLIFSSRFQTHYPGGYRV